MNIIVWLKTNREKFLRHYEKYGLHKSINASFNKLFPNFIQNKNIWGFKYAIRKFIIDKLPSNPFYKLYVTSKIVNIPRLQLGAGETICDGWLHQDMSKFQRRKHKNLDFTINVLRLKKYIKKGTLNSIFTSHMLEHLPRHEVKELIASCSVWLKPGGKLWISVPDLSILYAIAKDASTSHKDRDSAMMLISTPSPGHVSCWFFEDLKYILETSGFEHVEQWMFPPFEFQNMEGCWNVTIAGKNISLNVVAEKRADTVT